MLFYHLIVIEITDKDYSTKNSVYFQNISTSFEVGTNYMLKTTLTLNFQVVTATPDIIFEFIGSMQLCSL